MRQVIRTAAHLASIAFVLYFSVGLCSAVATTTWTYSDPVCVCDAQGCDSWSWTISCVVSGGIAGQPSHIITAVEAPADLGWKANLRDGAGNSVIILGTTVEFVDSPADAAAAAAQHGTAPGRVWKGFRTNIQLPSSVGASAATFKVTYGFAPAYSGSGKAWFTSNTDTLYGNIETDALNVFPASSAVPALGTWGLAALGAMLLGIGVFMLKRRMVSSS